MARFVLYSHDTYGLGHFRRSSLIAAGLANAAPDNEVLIVTGSPRAQSFSLPDRVDTVKLPSATKDDDGAYRPRKLGGHINRLVALRSGIICSAVGSFEPDVVLVDHAPLGMAGELAPLLRAIDRSPARPRLVLGLRDIIDAAPRVERSWHCEGVWNALDHYDDILVYGDPDIATTASDLRLDRRVRADVVHTGYTAPTMPDPLPVDPFLLVTPGGGGDGQALLRTHLDAVEAGATAGLPSLIVTGPLLSAGRRAELMVRAAALPDVEIVEFADNMRSLIASATGVISMAGYNTVVEELAAGVPSLLVPRSHPRLEQHIRAERLASHTNLEHCPLEDLRPARVAAFAAACRQAAATPRIPAPVDLAGVARTVAHLSGDRVPVAPGPAPSSTARSSTAPSSITPESFHV